MRSRRSISDIVAVVLLIVIAIAAAVIIYMWLSGLIGSVHTSTTATQVKLEITGANVTETPGTTSSTYTVYATVYNPPDSPTTTITLGELELTNGTMICSTNNINPAASSYSTTVTPDGSSIIKFSCTGPATSPGPVEVFLVTSQGVQVSFTTSITTTTS